MQPPITESRTLGRDLSQPRPQRRVVPLLPPVTATPPGCPQQPTGASLAHPSFFARDPHRCSLRQRAYHFFDSTTFSASRSSACCPRSSSAVRSRPPAGVAAEPRSLPTPHTWPSSDRTWHRSRLSADRVP